LNPRAVSPNGLWKDIFQQDSSYPGRDNPNAAISEFFDRIGGEGWSGVPGYLEIDLRAAAGAWRAVGPGGLGPRAARVSL
jgi:hypothetical protein